MAMHKKGNTNPFRVVIFARAKPQWVWRLARRIEEEVVQAQVCGIVYEASAHGVSSQMGLLRQPSRDPFRLLVFRRIAEWVARGGSSLGHMLLRWAHACPANPNAMSEFTLETLQTRSQAAGWPVLITEDVTSPEALDFARRQDAALGIVAGIRVGKQGLFALPGCGSLTTAIGQIEPGQRGGGQQKLRIEVQWVEAGSHASSVVSSRTLAVDPYDTRTSLALKADLIGSDMLVHSVGNLARKAMAEPTEPAYSTMLAQAASECERAGAASGVGRPWRTRSLWKMWLAALLFSPYVILRNWYRRWRGRSPVVILFHHLVSDRPHHLGLPTEIFLREIQFLQKHYRILHLPEAIELLKSRAVRVPAVVLTFDDGYQENLVTLRAVFEETGVPVSLFVCTQLVEEHREFPHDLAKGERGFWPLTWEQIAYLAGQGVEIGSHTRTHFDCGSGDPKALEGEIVGSRDDLERRLGRPVHFFSFPWGRPENMPGAAMELARATYQHGLSTLGGANFPNAAGDLWHLRRQFQSGDLWELELGLQGVFELTQTVKRMIRALLGSMVQRGKQHSSGAKTATVSGSTFGGEQAN